MSRRVVFLLLLCCAVTNLFAGQVVFKNGDRITGTIDHLSGGKLVIVSDVAGKLVIDADKVESITTEKPVKVHVTEDRVVNSEIRAVSSAAGMVELVSNAKTDSLPFENIHAINLPVIKYPLWSGDITAAYNSKHGNTTSTDIAVDISLKRQTKKHDLYIDGEHALSKEEESGSKEKITTEDSWLFKIKDQYNLSNNRYRYLEGSYEKDRVAELDRRIIAGLGLGRKWIDNDTTHFKSDIGLANIDERYSDSTASNSVSGQLGYYFDHKVNGSVMFIHDLAWYPGIEDPSDYYLRTKAELRLKMTDRLFTSFKAELDYDAVPSDDAETTDIKYMLGLGYKF